MAGYTRVDTSNNIADGNVISAADLDNEFDGIQAAFNASTGHNHDGTTGEGAPISVLGPTQDVVVGASTVTPKTTNTVDIGSSSLKFKDLYLAGNASIGGTLAVTGATTLSSALTYGGVTLSNAVTGTGNMVLSASPTLTGTLSGTNASLSGTLAVTGVATLTAQPILSSLTASRAVFTDGSKGLVSNAITGTGNVVMSASPTLTGTVAGASLQLSSLTSGRVTYAGASGLLQDSANLTFNGTDLTVSGAVNAGTINATTLDLTNLEVTNIKAKDGTAGMQIADSTGVVSFTANPVMSGGTANGVAYLNGSKVLTTGSALTFDGTRLTSITGKFGGGAAANSASLMVNNATNTATGIQLFQDGIESWIMGMPANSAALTWSASGSEQMRLTSTGLGIGTSSPSFKLHVETSVNGNDGAFIRNTNTGSSASGNLSVASGVGAIAIRAYSAAHSVWPNSALLVSDSAFTGGLNILQSGANPINFWTNGSERARIDSSGNLGIGTSSPAFRLDVGGQDGTNITIRSTGTSSARFRAYVNSAESGVIGFLNGGGQFFEVAGSEQMRLTSTGLGIGTSSPSASAILDAQSTTKGVRMPNMTTAQKNAIASPAAGLMVFDTTLSKLCVYTGAAWETITSI